LGHLKSLWLNKARAVHADGIGLLKISMDKFGNYYIIFLK